MSNKIMKTLTLGGNTYEIYDESARTDIVTLQTETSELQQTVNDLKQNGTGTGSGGTDDYSDLENKPQINGVTLEGNKTSEDLGIGNPTDEQVASAVGAYLDEHPEASTTVADGSIYPVKTDFLKHIKAGEEWQHTLVANGYLGVATNEYLDIQGLEKLIVLVEDTTWSSGVYIACFDENKTQLQGFTVVSNYDNQRLVDIYKSAENVTLYTLKTTLDLQNIVVENTRFIQVKVAQYKSTDDSSIKIYTSEYYNGENYIEWNDEKYENRILKDNAIQLKHTDFITYNNPNLIDVTNIKSTSYTSDTSDLTHPMNQFAIAHQMFFADYIDVRENKSIYVRTVRASSLSDFPYIVACYDDDKNFISNELATNILVSNIGSYNITTIMEDGYEVVNAQITVHRIDLPSEVSFIRLRPILSLSINAYDTKYILVLYDNILNLTAVAETYEKNVSSEWKEAIEKALESTEQKTMVMIGDSLTNWGGGNDADSGFLKNVHDKTGIITKNEGYAGATWQDSDSQTYSAVDRINTIVSEERKYDLYCFLMGTNGGSPTDTGETSTDTTTMSGAIRYCMETLKAYDPTAHILVCLPPQRAEGNENQEKVNEVIKSIVESYGVKTLDVYHHSGIVPNTKISNIGYLSDGLHLGENGIIALGNLLASEVKYLLCL